MCLHKHSAACLRRKSRADCSMQAQAAPVLCQIVSSAACAKHEHSLNKIVCLVWYHSLMQCASWSHDPHNTQQSTEQSHKLSHAVHKVAGRPGAAALLSQTAPCKPAQKQHPQRKNKWSAVQGAAGHVWEPQQPEALAPAPEGGGPRLLVPYPASLQWVDLACQVPA